MLQHNKPDDWVLATGHSITVSEFLDLAFKQYDLDFNDFVESSDKHFRPNEVEYLLGDASKAKNELGWKPKTDINELVKLMVEEDTLLAERELVLIKNNLIKPTWEHPVIK